MLRLMKQPVLNSLWASKFNRKKKKSIPSLLCQKFVCLSVTNFDINYLRTGKLVDVCLEFVPRDQLELNAHDTRVSIYQILTRSKCQVDFSKASSSILETCRNCFTITSLRWYPTVLFFLICILCQFLIWLFPFKCYIF